MENLYDPAHVCDCGLTHEPGKAHHLQSAASGTRVDELKQKVVDIRNRVTPVVRDGVEQARASVDRAALIAKTRAHVAGLKARHYARTNPVLVAGVSAGIGAVLGMIARGILRRNRHLGVLVVETRPHSHALI